MAGYIVVHAKNLGKHFIVNVKWVLEFDYEKHITNSINRNQEHIAFYSSKPESRKEDGSPNSRYKPKFDLPFYDNYEKDFDFEHGWEGVFICNLLHFFRQGNFVLSLINQRYLTRNFVGC